MNKPKDYTEAKFRKEIKQEINLIKKHATTEEIENLDFETFNPDVERQCVYGQMTGNCRSPRASVLIRKCCKRFVIRDGVGKAKIGYRAIIELINGIKSSKEDLGTAAWDAKYFSALETYILFPQTKNKKVISYLKGERDTLSL